MNRKNKAIPIRDMVYTALFTAVLCAIAPFSIAVGPIPLSLATLVIYIAAGTLGWKYGTLAVMLYILLGAAGLPVFTGFQGGFHKIAGVTGGYIIGYIPCALATGFFAEASGNKLRLYASGMVIGTVILYTGGTAWFMFQTGNTPGASLALCVVPFLPGDAIKIAISCIATPQLRNAIGKSKF